MNALAGDAAAAERLPLAAALIGRMQSLASDGRPVALLLAHHLLLDTEAALALLVERGFEIAGVVGISHSTRADVAARLRARHVRLRLPAADAMSNEAALALADAANRCGAGGAALLILDVGGHFAPALAATPASPGIVGVIEDTRRGLWRYQEHFAARPPPFPVIEIATAELKKPEERRVGRRVVQAVAQDLASIGADLHGARVGVLGYGGIGAAVAAAAAGSGAAVRVYDSDPVRAVLAWADGLGGSDRAGTLERSTVLIGATGRRSVEAGDLRTLPDGALLVSASSGDAEFPVNALRAAADATRPLSPHLDEFRMPWGKTLRLASEGFPANFRGESLPAPLSDLLFAQVALGLQVLLRGDLAHGIHRLSPEQERHLAGRWTDQYGSLPA